MEEKERPDLGDVTVGERVEVRVELPKMTDTSAARPIIKIAKLQIDQIEN